MNNNDKGVIASGWIGMETLCKLYPEIFKPEIWLSENPPQIKQPKKKLVKRSK